MGVREYSNIKKRPLLGQDNNALVFLVAVNALLFVILLFLQLMYYISYDKKPEGDIFFQHQILDWFQVPASLGTLSSRPWTVLTYMFTHIDVAFFISNTLWLWCFGYILQDLAGNLKLIPIYLYGGVVGAIAYLTAVNLIPGLAAQINTVHPLIGSSAPLMAIAIATTALAPNYKLFPMLNGGIPLWVLTLIFVIFDFASVGRANAGTAIAHLAGGAMGFLFVTQLRRGRDWGQWMVNFVNWLDDLFNPEKKYQKQEEKDQLFYKNTTEPFSKTPNVTQQRVDAILDKINQEGYQMLTNEEKEFLKRASSEGGL